MNKPLKGMESGSNREKKVGAERTSQGKGGLAYGEGRSAHGIATIGARVRRLRLALGYTRPAFADSIGMTSSATRGWEAEGVEPSLSAVEAICRTFAVDRKWLLTGEGRPFPELPSVEPRAVLCPKASFLRDETVPFDAGTRRKTRRFVASLTPRQRDRALLFYTDLVAALRSEGAEDRSRGGAQTP